jgi:hypothetical protein
VVVLLLQLVVHVHVHVPVVALAVALDPPSQPPAAAVLHISRAQGAFSTLSPIP